MNAHSSTRPLAGPPGATTLTPSKRSARPFVLVAVGLGVVAAGYLQPLHAQEQAAAPGGAPSIGVMGGFSSAKTVISGEGASVTLDARRGISFGVSLTYPISNQAHLGAEGIYVQKGFNASSGGESAWIKLSYLEAPLFLRYDVQASGMTPFVLAGGWLALKTSCNAGESSGGTSLAEPCGSDVKASDFGGMVGAGVADGRLSASIRYTHGLASFLDEFDGTSWRNRVLMLLAAYRVSRGDD